MRKRLLELALLLGISSAEASVLPTGLTPLEIDELVQAFAFPSATRTLRSAEAYDIFPGVRLGVEVCLVPADRISSMGDRNASIPSVIPIPRLQLVKGLMGGGELSFSLFPAQLENTLGTYGGTIKWNLQDEYDDWLALATYLGFTHASGFRDTYQSSTLEWSIIASRDFVRVRPFFGGGLMTAAGSVSPILAAGPNESSRRFAIHTFLGVEIELPANLSFQLDLFNLQLAGSFAVSARF